MGQFIKDDVVILPFPFSDLSGSKRRPAFVVTDLPGEDIILCQITSKAKHDPFSVSISASDFLTGSLPLDSFVRPNKLFTADKSLVLSTAGRLSKPKTGKIISHIVSLIKKGKITAWSFLPW
ncbi:MAG: type II toxin-antitoxin system PemK/MazF family toxin [Spirochaetaceae bacterium]|nr:type II toxin-antitoxin system PemK/MazF family toxin [Spirochaetaceae bacterium]